MKSNSGLNSSGGRGGGYLVRLMRPCEASSAEVLRFQGTASGHDQWHTLSLEEHMRWREIRWGPNIYPRSRV